MKYLLLALPIVFIARCVNSLHYLKFPSDRKIPDYSVSEPKHFAIVQNTDLGPLPEQFSICTSISTEYNRDFQTFFAIMDDNDLRWMALDISQQLEEETYSFWFMTEAMMVKSDKSVDARNLSTF